MKGNEHKYHSLDGLRGLAALVVVLLHYVTAFAPFLLGFVVTQRHTALDKMVAAGPLQLPVAGDFAVCIFFVLSGFVLSLSFFKHKTIDVLISSAARRYFRLMLPALGSVLLVYLILSLGQIHAAQTAVLSESPWLNQFWHYGTNLFDALYQGLYGIFFTMFNDFGISYNPVLWTMHYELFGSFLVFVFLAFFGKLNNRWIFYLAFAVVALKTYYLAFIAGMAIADIAINYPRSFKAVSSKWLWGLLPVGLLLGSWTTQGIYPRYYGFLGLPSFKPEEFIQFTHIAGAVIVILAVLKLRSIGKLFETRPMQYLGKISFSIYLTHFVVMASLACFLFNHLLFRIGYPLALMSTAAISLPVTFGVAHLYTNYVDIPSIALSKKAGNFLINGEPSMKWAKKIKRRFKRKLPAFAASKVEEAPEN